MSIIWKKRISLLGMLLASLAPLTVTAEKIQSTTTSSTVHQNYSSSCPECTIQLGLENLEKVSSELGGFDDKQVELLKEDRYNPGVFFYKADSAIMRFTPGKPVECFLGNTSQNRDEYRYTPGNSSTAEFSAITDYLQYNQTKMLIADYDNGCIRGYDSDTDNVIPLLGYCNDNKAVKVWAYRLLEPTETVQANGKFRLYPTSMVLIESQQYLLVIDYKTDGIILRYDFNSNSVRRLYDYLHYDILQPYNMITNSRETMLYVTHSDGLSQVDLESLETTLLVGTDFAYILPFIPGPFDKVKIKSLEKDPIDWIIPDKVLLLIANNINPVLLFLNLIDRQVYPACPDADIFSTNTIVGSHQNCSLDFPTSTCASADRTIYVAATEKITFTRERSIYKLGTNAQYQQFIKEISPLIGRVSGGTVVTAKGLIPEDILDISLRTINGSYISPTILSTGGGQLRFKMPQSESTGFVSIRIELYDNITESYTFEYADDPVLLGILSALTIASGGIDVEFEVLNAASSDEYQMISLLPSLQNYQKCIRKGRRVFCGTKYPDEYITSITTKTNVTILLIDGDDRDNRVLSIYTNTPLTIFPNPTLDEHPIYERKSSRITLTGSPDVGDLNNRYQVSLQLVGERLNSRLNCTDVRVTANNLSCLVDLGEHQTDSTLAQVNVRLGNYNMTSKFLTFDMPEKAGAPETTTIATITISVIASFVLIAIIIVIFIKRHQNTVNKEMLETFNAGVFDWFSMVNVDLRNILDSFLIPSELLHIKEFTPIGEGNFGNVFLGELQQKDDIRIVAIKTLKELDTKSLTVIERFLEEAAILKDFDHANVLQTLGICIPKSGKPQVILPYMENGDMLSLIQNREMNFTAGDLLHFAKQVSCGMEYLADNKFIHRDLAARNCLVDSNYIVKVADFGLARDIYSKDYYRRDEGSGTPLPIKWLALECLYPEGVFTTKSDVWSYGVLMWELLTRGASPYTDVNPWEMKTYLEEGRRLMQPASCPPAIYRLMGRCWVEHSEDRPTFTQIHDFLSLLLEGIECSLQNPYSYIRDHTKDIPHDYVNHPTSEMDHKAIAVTHL